jgi:succinoglycan biosynthesis protein ExoL
MTSADALKVLVLAHDLSDAAIQRRVSMLRAGGARVMVAGFRRTPDAIREVAGCRVVDLGRTYAARFFRRTVSIARETALLSRHRGLFENADVVLARSLEMLAIAVRGRSLRHPAPVLIYESLDIHRLLLRRDAVGAAMRALEGRLARHASAVVTSSPAFVSGYFNELSRVKLPIKLMENKIFDPLPAFTSKEERNSGPRWKIGWFGIIRCKRSLHILADLARQSAGQIEIVIRGRPYRDQFGDFEKLAAAIPGVRFGGPYKLADLPAMYREVHFNWAIDMFEEGLNSAWLLPNRLYEGGAYNCVPIADEAVESGRFLKRLGVGVMLRQPLGVALADFFAQLTAEKYRALESAVADVPRKTWVCTAEDCQALVDYMRSLKAAG